LLDRSDFTLPRTARGVPRRRCRSANLVPADRCRRRAPGHPNLPASSRDLNDRRRRPPGQRFNDIKRGPTAWPASSTASRRIAYRLFQRGPMTLTFRISLLAIGLASLLGPDGALAGTLVEFPNLPEHTPANLSGYLARRRFGGRARQFFQRWRTVPGDCLGRLRGRAKCINLGHCTSGCAQGAKTRTDITYWSAAC